MAHEKRFGIGDIENELNKKYSTKLDLIWIKYIV